MTVRAIFENGSFRPLGPVALAEGTGVELSVSPDDGSDGPQRAESLRQLFAEYAAATADEPDDGYDILAALDANRKYCGAYRMLSPGAPTDD